MRSSRHVQPRLPKLQPRARTPWRASCGLILLLAVGCDAPDPAHDREKAGPDRSADNETTSPDAVSAVIPAEREALCARPADDAVRDIFCQGPRPSVTSLRELLTRLEVPTLPVGLSEAEVAELPFDATKIEESAVLLGHSTALSGQLVSPINPRAILIAKRTLVAFQRGVQKVEIATTDRVSGRRNFYLVSFDQACNARSEGCLPGDLYTLAVESDWTSVVLEDDEDLKNTPRDCRMCHQRNRETPVLLMRELLGPWLHFFFVDRDQDPHEEGEGPAGRALVRAYREAKGDESYAGLSGRAVRMTAGVTLQKAVRSEEQMLVFDLGVTQQTTDGTGRSAAWDVRYEEFKRGVHLALPHFRSDPTDPDKRAALSAAYARYRSGELARDALPDLADIFPDDPQTRAEIGLQTEPGASPAEALIQACGACHNDVLDQTISRARFNIALSRMSRSELDVAIARIKAPADSHEVMPPKGMRQLDQDTKARLLEYLGRSDRDSEDEAMLESAAQLGMSQRSY